MNRAGQRQLGGGGRLSESKDLEDSYGGSQKMRAFSLQLCLHGREEVLLAVL
jgi:hypothetical protein